MRLKEGEVYFNNNSSLKMNIFLEEYPEIPIDVEEYEEIKVEGRNGSLYVNKNTYQDKPITFTFTLVSNDFEIDFEEVYNWLTDIKDNRLIWGRGDRCYLVKKVTFGNLKKEFRSFGEFDVTFICEPFNADLEITSLEVPQLEGLKFNYEGTAPTELIVKITAKDANKISDFKITTNNNDFTIQGVDIYAEINTSFLTVRGHDPDLILDNKTSGPFPTLEPGMNFITFTGDFNVDIEFRKRYKGA